MEIIFVILFARAKNNIAGLYYRAVVAEPNETNNEKQSPYKRRRTKSATQVKMPWSGKLDTKIIGHSYLRHGYLIVDPALHQPFFDGRAPISLMPATLPSTYKLNHESTSIHHYDAIPFHHGLVPYKVHAVCTYFFVAVLISNEQVDATVWRPLRCAAIIFVFPFSVDTSPML